MEEPTPGEIAPQLVGSPTDTLTDTKNLFLVVGVVNFQLSYSLVTISHLSAYATF